MSDFIERLRAVARKYGMAYDDIDAIEEAVALVEAVEAAPVVRFWLGDTSDSFVVNTPEESEAVQIGKHVRLLPAPPAIDAAMAGANTKAKPTREAGSG